MSNITVPTRQPAMQLRWVKYSKTISYFLQLHAELMSTVSGGFQIVSIATDIYGRGFRAEITARERPLDPLLSRCFLQADWAKLGTPTAYVTMIEYERLK